MLREKKIGKGAAVMVGGGVGRSNSGDGEEGGMGGRR